MHHPQIELIKKYETLITAETRYFICSGGRGSGKSYSVATYAVLKTFEKNNVILFTRWTMVSAHLSVIPEFLDKIETLELNHLFYITKNEVINKITGSRIIFRGIKAGSGVQTANLKSIEGLNILIVDESEELTDESTFDRIDLSIRSSVSENKVIMVLNPSTKTHWIYSRFFEQAGVNPGFNGTKGNVTYIHTDYRDNIGNLSQSFVDQIELIKETNPKKYEHVILGGWLNKAEGVVFDNWQLGKFEEPTPPVWGMDFGFSLDPTTLVKVSVDKKKKHIYVKEYLYKPKMTTSDIAAAIDKHTQGQLIYADSAEPRLIEELKRAGKNVRPAEKGPGSVTAGVALLQDYKLIIDSESTNIVKELNNYVWNDKKSSTPIDAYNHALDALRYAVSSTLGKTKISYRLA